MLPLLGSDPKINVVVLGARLIEELRNGNCSLEDLLFGVSPKLKVSADHVILTLDWLFAISVIDFYEGKVRIK